MRIHRSTFELIAVIIFLLLVSMSGTIVPQLTVPKDRVFAGFQGYSPDYIQYVSYIKEGMYGRYNMDFRSFPPKQPVTPIHWEYILFGILLGPLGISAPVAYHVIRIILGALFIFTIYNVFLAVFRSHHLALLSTIVACVSSSMGWIARKNGSWQIRILNYFPFASSTPQRITDRPHYILGSILFLIIFRIMLRKSSGTFIRIGLIVLSFFTVMIHIASGIVLGFLSLVLIGIPLISRTKEIHRTNDIWNGLSIGFGCGMGALVTYYYVTIYARVSDIFVDKFAYGGTVTFASVWNEILSFGPLLWIGLPGLIICISMRHNLRLRERMLMSAWGVIHILLFFALFRFFHVDQVRFVQSLYFIPLTYGAIWLLWTLSKRFGRLALYGGILLILFLSLPTYISQVYADLYAMTDYQSFAPFGFPTKNQYAAYEFLDQHSPVESTVLAQYEAANMLLMYSHNRVLGNDQGWTPEGGETMKQEVARWFSGTESNSEAKNYLIANHISYVFYGYRERALGDITKYTFLQKIYKNPEVAVYSVND